MSETNPVVKQEVGQIGSEFKKHLLGRAKEIREKSDRDATLKDVLVAGLAVCSIPTIGGVSLAHELINNIPASEYLANSQNYLDHARDIMEEGNKISVAGGLGELPILLTIEALPENILESKVPDGKGGNLKLSTHVGPFIASVYERMAGQKEAPKQV